MNMENKVVLITGASSGLGKALMEKFIDNGNYKVYAGIKNAKEELVGIKGVTRVNLDVTRDSDVEQFIDLIMMKEKRIDVLINNAGITLVGQTDKFDIIDYKNILDVNSIGAFRLIKKSLPLMKENGGRIINIVSLNGVVAFPNFGLYSSSKFAEEALGTSLRYELYKENIFVTNIIPGAIKREKELDKGLPHKSAREKFVLLKILMPMLTYKDVARQIIKCVENPCPPARVLLGNDALLTCFLNKLVPNNMWDKIMLYVWNKK